MLTEAQLQQIEKSFRMAAEEFDFTFERPFVLSGGITAFGHISDYGSRNGTVIFLISPPDYNTENRKQVNEWCEANQMFYSYLNAEQLTGDYRRSYFREMLRDFGRFGEKPVWD